MNKRFRSQLSKEHVKNLLDRQNVSISEFRLQYWGGGNSHTTLDYFDRASRITLPNLIKLCDILKLTPNEVLQYSDTNIDNLKRLGMELTSSLSHDLMSVQNELSQEKIKNDALIEKVKYLENSLKEKQDLINYFTKLGQNSDK